MPTATYIALANITLSSNDNEIVFTSIPTTGYRDFVLVIDQILTGVAANKIVTLNDDTGNNYPWVYMGGNGSSAISGTNTSSSLLVEALAAGSTTERLLTIVNFMDASATDKQKTVLVRNGRAGQGTDAIASRWANTGAITKISIGLNNVSANFAAGSTFALYGIVS